MKSLFQMAFLIPWLKKGWGEAGEGIPDARYNQDVLRSAS